MITGQNSAPTFNIKMVVAQTGIKPDTLRAWERRYGLPHPQRSKGKQRLYSAHDIETIKWLAARQAQGMSISHAVQLWEALQEKGQNPLLLATKDRTGESTDLTVSGTRIEDFQQSWTEACRDFDESSAEQLLGQAFAIYPPETVCLQIIMPSLAELGRQWYAGEASVQQEHFASALAMRRLHALMAAAPPPTRPERIIVACPPQEYHAFVPLLLSLMLRYRGWDIIYLGTDVPRDRFEATLDTIHPQLVLLTAQQLHTAASLQDIASLLQEQDVPLAFGGLIFNLIPDLHKRIPGHFLGPRIEDTPRMVQKLIALEPPVPNVSPVASAYLDALSQFQQQQSEIELHLWQQLLKVGIPRQHFATANNYMARNITSALTLGDMDYLGGELEWIHLLMANYRLPEATLQLYLTSYYEAVDLFLDDRGQPIVDWLADIIQNNMTSGSL